MSKSSYESNYKKYKKYIKFSKKKTGYKNPWDDPNIKRQITKADHQLRWRVRQVNEGRFIFHKTKQKKIVSKNTKTNKGVFIPHFGPPNEKPQIIVKKNGQVEVRYRQAAYSKKVVRSFIPIPSAYMYDRSKSEAWLSRQKDKLYKKYGSRFTAYWITVDNREIGQAEKLEDMEIENETLYEALTKTNTDGHFIVGLAGISVVVRPK